MKLKLFYGWKVIWIWQYVDLYIVYVVSKIALFYFGGSMCFWGSRFCGTSEIPLMCSNNFSLTGSGPGVVLTRMRELRRGPLLGPLLSPLLILRLHWKRGVTWPWYPPRVDPDWLRQSRSSPWSVHQSAPWSRPVIDLPIGASGWRRDTVADWGENETEILQFVIAVANLEVF